MSTVPISKVVLHVLDLLDQVQIWVVSLLRIGLSAGFQIEGMLLASACSTSIIMGNVPLSLRISYPHPIVSLLEGLLFEQMHRYRVNSPMCGTKFYQSSFFACMAGLWNSLTNECFPPDYSLTAFKERVNKVLLLK